MERTPGFTVQVQPLTKDFNVSNDETPGFWTAKRIAWITGAACVACCMVPALGLAIGSASIAGLAMYSDKAALVVAVIGAGLLLFKRLTRPAAPACDIDGSCKPKS